MDDFEGIRRYFHGTRTGVGAPAKMTYRQPIRVPDVQNKHFIAIVKQKLWELYSSLP